MPAALATPTVNQTSVTSKLRAVAYYRHSAEDRREQSIAFQRDRVREWADKNGVEIIHEFTDAGKSGLNAEDRPAFNELMDDWVTKRNDFHYVLCLDVSRWGRFQAAERAVVHSITCQRHGKYVIYTAITKLSVPTSGDES